ncbi:MULTISPECIES: YpmS family protein [unclassified Cytobacillus]|uniref:YpmS family protein n=1 Tax=unclassified Cytobacillus TaxID=2675268 RepID=UPI001357BE85|nr:YpmS family protein [Cytobacillus sp. AMY 15.2]KAF0818666.1 YfaA [Bacillus sp. ZZV12-4809]MCM3091180.1 YpmS family protein [Cytobacillus sp. AMY 15.2]
MKDRKWKKLFIGLLAINALVLAALFIIISMPADDEDYTAVTLNSDNYVPFNIKANKEDLNRVINHYLEKEGLTGAIDYKVLLNDEVDLYGTIPFFSQDLQMKLSFEPEALENGDVVLQQKSISVGQLNLPVSHVLKLVKDRYKLPEGVTIQPKKERIYVSLQEMKLKSDVKVKVDEFNLKQDDIRFTLLVPVN